MIDWAGVLGVITFVGGFLVYSWLSVGVRPETGHDYAVLDADEASLVSPQSYTCRYQNEICDWPTTMEVCRDDVTDEIVDTNYVY